MTILSETTKYTLTTTGGIVLLLGVVLCAVFAAIGARYDNLSLTIVGVVILLAAGFSTIYFKVSYQEIKAIISDDYPATELYDKYDVVKRDGEIWILDERIEK